MFTGIVEEVGAVRRIRDGSLVVGCATVSLDSGVGASVAVSGTCLTVVERGPDELRFDLSPETMSRTTLGSLGPGDRVNLERPVSLAARMGGHLVQGHVDGVADVEALDPDGAGGAVLRVRLPGGLDAGVVPKGSIALDGVSLTVASLDGDAIEIALIPHTLAATTLGELRAGARCNVETDVIAKYVERLIERAQR
ncbi:MAG TPA: riboflavin synthase [Actinomycetota bacterium]|nr:riboflavin synthase [Actinomycetota bacterium]